MAETGIRQREVVKQKVTSKAGSSGRTGLRSPGLEVLIPDVPVRMGSAWRASEITDSDWRVTIPAAALHEFEIIADALAEYDKPLDELAADSFD